MLTPVLVLRIDAHYTITFAVVFKLDAVFAGLLYLIVSGKIVPPFVTCISGDIGRYELVLYLSYGLCRQFIEQIAEIT